MDYKDEAEMAMIDIINRACTIIDGSKIKKNVIASRSGNTRALVSRIMNTRQNDLRLSNFVAMMTAVHCKIKLEPNVHHLLYFDAPRNMIRAARMKGKSPAEISDAIGLTPFELFDVACGLVVLDEKRRSALRQFVKGAGQ